ncbi:MAG: spore coat protein U domain-containing protein [Rhodanobacter sp.]
MLVKKTMLASAMIVFGGLSAAAMAATTTTFDVKINITSVCNVASATATPIDFGDVPANTTTLQTKNNTLSVTCSTGTPYSIGLTTPLGAAGAGSMLGQDATPVDNTADAVPYTLYQPTSTGTGITALPWGDTGALAGVLNWHSTGTGLVQSVNVYATVLGTDLNHIPGHYLDTVTVHVYL